ncbi:MAG: SDR family NAD(P)-dependent oxidoreductase [Alphaproteobacteria bacterium]|nr:SDR family NAD(P)-dependent oxidoreductase [Alphaproteobacteria bacterium]
MFRIVGTLSLIFIFFGTIANAETVMVTGANRGIGLEFARQYADKGWTVIATHRREDIPESLASLKMQYASLIRIETMDVTNHSGIDALAKKLDGIPIDLIVHNAGISGGGSATQQFGRLDYSTFQDVMDVNVAGPLKISEAFLDHVAASDGKVIFTVTSSQGSIGSVNRPGLFYYRASKSAVNMVMRNLAQHPKITGNGILIGLIAPGATDTDFMAEVRGRMPLGDPKERVAGMIAQIESYPRDGSTLSFEWDGEEIPW